MAKSSTDSRSRGVADFTGPADLPDGVVDALDFMALIAAWGDCPPPAPEELNGGGDDGLSPGLVLVWMEAGGLDAALHGDITAEQIDACLSQPPDQAFGSLMGLLGQNDE